MRAWILVIGLLMPACGSASIAPSKEDLDAARSQEAYDNYMAKVDAARAAAQTASPSSPQQTPVSR